MRLCVSSGSCHLFLFVVQRSVSDDDPEQGERHL